MIYLLSFKWLNEPTFVWNKMKRRFKKDTLKESIYIFVDKNTIKKLMEREFHYWEKSWEEIRAYREIFEVEKKTENILRVNKRVYEVFTITDL